MSIKILVDFNMLKLIFISYDNDNLSLKKICITIVIMPQDSTNMN